MLTLGAIVGFTAYRLSDSAGRLLDALPEAAQKIRQVVREQGRGDDVSALETVQQAAVQIEKAAEEGSVTAPPKQGVTRVTIERPPFSVRDYLWSGTVGVAAAAGQLTLVVFLTYFALASGDGFRRKLVKTTGPGLEKKKLAVRVLDDIARQVQGYLRVQILTCAIVGVSTGIAFWAIGLENAAVWGIIASVVNLVPYVGVLAIMSAAGVVAFLQFNALEPSLLVAGASLVINVLEGNLLTPWLTSRASSMNPLAVFISVMFWGWLWGVWGLLLGMPITMVIKAVCDRIDGLRAVGELMGE
jgi:predicted PurR-regulated permease PerM